MPMFLTNTPILQTLVQLGAFKPFRITTYKKIEHQIKHITSLEYKDTSKGAQSALMPSPK